MRIASLLASATEIAYGLGLGDAVVAISHECDYPPEALTKPRISRPRVELDGLDSGAIDAAVRDAMSRYGGVYEVDEDRLREADPDLILTQAVCEVCAVPTSLAEQAAAVLAGRPRILSLDSHTIAEILESVRAVGEAAGVLRRAEVLIASLRARIARVAAQVAGATRPRVLALEWLDPPFVPGHWTPEMITAAGGVTLAASAQAPSRQVTWNALATLDPDVLLVMPCGYRLPAAGRDAARHAARLLAVAGRAVAAGRGDVLNGSDYFNRSGPRMVDGIELLAALLHPDRVRGVALAGKAEVWRPNDGAPSPGETSSSPNDTERITDSG